MPAADVTDWLVAEARRIGFDLCGVAPAAKFPELARLPDWLARGHAGEMHYLDDPRRTDPSSVLPGVRSIIVCALNYNTAHPPSTERNLSPLPPSPTSNLLPPPSGLISRYAWGDDYHRVLGEKLEKLLSALRTHITEPFDARAYVDTGPIHERIAAHHASLGWLGKNTLLLNDRLGSFLFLGVILTTLELAPSLAPTESPPPDLCGNCTLCLDACPTGALVAPHVLDARLCISYLTIEHRGPVPESLRPALGRHVFGCDICQDVCPYNRTAPTTASPAFQPRSDSSSSHSPRTTSHSLLSPSLEWLASLTEDDFRTLFKNSPVKRTKYRGLIRNACYALANSAAHFQNDPAAHSRVTTLLSRLSQSRDAVISGAARYALSRLT